jgi:hypothetical protein
LDELSLRILFVPVSGPYGMGEFARCSAIARAALERWPHASVHFLLSRHAPYIPELPFPATLLPSSATFHTAAVIELMRSWLPDVVIFDNAGRSAQLESARRLGARIVFISSRRRQRRRAFRFSWMRLIDEHWIPYPKLIAGELGLMERAKLKLLGRPVVRYLDVILARTAKSPMTPVSGADPAPSMRSKVVVIPGGGTGHPGAQGATRQFLLAAGNLAAAGFATTFVGPAQDTGSGGQSGANGGATLLQAIACGAPCVAAPIAGDQRERIRACAAAGVAVEAAPHAADLEAKARRLLEDEPARAALAHRAAALKLADGVQVALDALESLSRRS